MRPSPLPYIVNVDVHTALRYALVPGGPSTVQARSSQLGPLCVRIGCPAR